MNIGVSGQISVTDISRPIFLPGHACPENIGSAKKLSLACQEEFGVGAPSFLQAGLGEKEYNSTEGLTLGNFCTVPVRIQL